jgi:hypothetical protein
MSGDGRIPEIEVLAPAVEDTTGVVFTGQCQAIHRFFGLSYANYLVLPRTILQSMPDEWQARFVAMLQEVDDYLGDYPNSYEVRLRDDSGRYVRDDLADYERGRRIIPEKDRSPTP